MSVNWDERYSDTEFAYGKEPNAFFKEWIDPLEPGKILMPADGEGRNGVYAGTLGWKVTSFDLSREGKAKALRLAKEWGVSMDYLVGDFSDLQFDKESFDAIGLIYAHFPASKKSEFHKRLSSYLKPGGTVIFEAYSKKNLELRKKNPRIGGPTDLDMLFSSDEIMKDFIDYETIHLTEEKAVLEEGKYHQGVGSVIRFVGRKRSFSIQ